MKEYGAIRSDMRKRYEEVARIVADLPAFHDSKAPKMAVFEGREAVSFDNALPARLLATPSVIDYAKERRLRVPIPSAEKALSATVTLHEGKITQLTQRRSMRRITRSGR